MKKLKKEGRGLPYGFREPTVPLKSAALRKATKAVMFALSQEPQARTADDLHRYLSQATCLTTNEIDAALKQLLYVRSLVGDDAGGWTVAQARACKTGVVMGARGGAYQFRPDDETEVFVLHGVDHLAVFPGDRVSAMPKQFMDGKFRVATLEALIERRDKTHVCRFGHYCRDGIVCVVPVDPFAQTPIYVEAQADELKNQIVVVELDDEPMYTPWGAMCAQGRVVERLGDQDDSEVELEVALRRFELPHVFSEETIREAEALPDDVPAREARHRVDLRDIAFVTIDGEDARDFDDAVWCTTHGNGWRLLVAIADVSHYVKPGSALDRDAQERATSVYFPRRVIPMLPEKLSNGLCSLNPHVDRCTLVCDMVISEHGQIEAYQFYPALIHSHARLTYTSVWNALRGEPSDFLERGGNLEDARRLYALYKALRQERKRRGAIDFESAETQIVCSPQDGHITAIVRREHNDAHRLIEECMLAANVCAADFVTGRKALCLYRVHESPSVERLESLRATLAAFQLKLGGGDAPRAEHFDRVVQAVKGQPWSECVQMAMLRSMQQAMYSPDNVGHYGLGYVAYTHFTSPIRRYPDLLVHRTIRALLSRRKYAPEIVFDTSRLMTSRAAQLMLQKRERAMAQGENEPKTDPRRDIWTRLGTICSAAERRADEASRDVVSWLKCMYMKNLIGKRFEGRITGVNPAGVYVTLTDLFVEGFVHISRIGDDYFVFEEATNSLFGDSSGKRYRMGDTMRVQVMQVDVEARRIDFKADCPKRPTRSRSGRFDDVSTFGSRAGVRQESRSRRPRKR